MKKYFEKIIKFSLVLITFVIISLLIDLFIFNFDVLILDKEERGIFNISDYNDEIIDDKRVIGVNLDDKYVNKIKITYDASKDSKVTIYYTGEDYYEENIQKQFSDVLGFEVNKQVTSLDDNIEELKIVFETNNDVEIKKIVIDNNIQINYLRVIYFSMIMLLLFVIYKFYKNGGSEDKIHKYFLIAGLIVGSIMIIIQPTGTFYSWDDETHFSNAYQLIGGDIVWKTGEQTMIDVSYASKRNINTIEEQIQRNEYLNIDEDSNHTSSSSNFITYNKICYIPSAIGFYLCRLLRLPFTVCFKMGKFMNLFAYLLVFSLAIKIAKNGKRILAVIGLIPTSIFLASQYSYDPAVTSGITLGVVCAFNWILDKDSKVDFKSMFIFIFAMLYGCFPKAVFIPLILIFLFVPKERFKNRKEEILLKVGVVVICLLVMSTFVLPTVTNTMGSDTRGGNTSVSEQLALILDNPIGYINVLKDTMIDGFMSNLFSKNIIMFYSYIGGGSDNLYLAFLLFMLFVCITDNIKNDFKLKDKLLLLIGVLGVILLVWTALYLSFTPVGLNTINGVQPRYFIPLLFPLMYIFKTKKIKNSISDKMYNTLVIAVPLILIVISLYEMFLLNYCM